MTEKYCQYCGKELGHCDCKAKLAAEHDSGWDSVKEEVKEYLKSQADKPSEDQYGMEIFVDYNEEFGNSTLTEISKADDSMQEMYNAATEWEWNARDYYYDELLKEIKSEIGDNLYDEYEEEISDYVNECVYWFLPDEVYAQEVNVVVALDTGDANTDFTECNILNWYGRHGGYGDKDNPLSELSPIRFIAESQGKLDEVKEIIRLELDDEVEHYDGSRFSKFTKSIKQELENGASHMLGFIFLLKMKLKDFCSLREMVRTKTGSITISPKTECGLYDVWSGGGSVLEVELEKEIKIPADKIWDAWIDCLGNNANGHGYRVDDVYGLWGGVWDYGDYKLEESAA